MFVRGCSIQSEPQIALVPHAHKIYCVPVRYDLRADECPTTRQPAKQSEANDGFGVAAGFGLRRNSDITTAAS